MENSLLDDDIISEEENIVADTIPTHNNKSLTESTQQQQTQQQSQQSQLLHQSPEKVIIEKISVIEIQPTTKAQLFSESDQKKVIIIPNYSQKCSFAYMDYLEHEKILGSTDIWSIHQFYKLIWLLTGFD